MPVAGFAPDGVHSDPERLPYIDVLRGLMALSVAVYHLAWLTHIFEAGSVGANAVALLGIYSVQGFFVISGLCFFHQYRLRPFGVQEAGRFYVRRFFRIAPLYYLTLALTLSWDDAAWLRVPVLRLLENVTLSFALFHPNHSLVLGGWSIGIECVFYLCFPLLLRVCRSRVRLFVALLALSLLPLWLEHGLRTAPEAARFHAYVRIPNHAFLFLLGAACAQGIARLRVRTSGRVLTGLSLLLLAATLGAWPPIYDHFALMHGPWRAAGVALASVLVLLCALGRRARPRRLAPLRLLGELSYALYLLHPLAWRILTAWGAPDLGPSALFGIALAMSLGLAYAVHKLYEQPLLAWGRQLSDIAGPRPRAPSSPRVRP